MIVGPLFTGKADAINVGLMWRIMPAHSGINFTRRKANFTNYAISLPTV
jgi:hypothetical protein